MQKTRSRQSDTDAGKNDEIPMKTWEENVRKVVPYVPGEQPKEQDIIKLNTNENPYPPAPGVKEVLSNFNTDDLRLYPDPRVDKLVNAIADFY